MQVLDLTFTSFEVQSLRRTVLLLLNDSPDHPLHLMDSGLELAEVHLKGRSLTYDATSWVMNAITQASKLVPACFNLKALLGNYCLLLCQTIVHFIQLSIPQQCV